MDRFDDRWIDDYTDRQIDLKIENQGLYRNKDEF